MKKNLLNILVLLITLCISNSLLGQVKSIDKKLNVQLTIEVKDENDKSNLSIGQQYDRYAISNTNVQNDFEFTRKETGTYTSDFFIAIETPKIILINLKPLYIEPNSHPLLKYSYSGLDEYKAPIQSLHVEGTDGIFLVDDVNVYQTKLSKDRVNVLNEIIKNKFDVTYSIKLLDSFANKHLEEAVKNNPKYDFTAKRKKFFKDYFFESYYNNIMVALRANSEKLMQLEQKVLALNKRVSLVDTLKYNQYFFAQRNIYLDFYQKIWKKNNFEFNIISSDLNGYDPLTQEYFLLLILKNDIEQIKDKLTLKKIRDAITNPVFRINADKYLMLKPSPDKGLAYLTNEIKSLPAFDSQLKQIAFGDIFKNTKQTYLYLDFCGSWCPPCIKEIEEYVASSRQFDNSKKVRPIWLFFENNKSSWLKVIEKYQLKRENCFLIIDNKLQQLFGQQFEWMGEFPHHFIFSKEGKIINSKAEPLINLKKPVYLHKVDR